MKRVSSESPTTVNKYFDCRYLGGRGINSRCHAEVPEEKNRAGSKKIHSEITMFVISCVLTDVVGESSSTRYISPGVKRLKETSVHKASAISSFCGLILRALQ